MGIDVIEEGEQVMLVGKELEVTCKPFKMSLLALVTDGVWLSELVTGLAESNVGSCEGASYWIAMIRFGMHG